MPYKDIEKKRSYQRAWIKRHRLIDPNANSHSNRRSARERIKIFKETHPCMDCGGEFPYVCMQFDHRDGSTKSANVSFLIWKNSAWSNVLAEIEKCDLVCANCHAIRGAVRMGKILLVDNRS